MYNFHNIKLKYKFVPVFKLLVQYERNEEWRPCRISDVQRIPHTSVTQTSKFFV